MKIFALVCGIALLIPVANAKDIKLAATSTYQLTTTGYRVPETVGTAVIGVNRTGTVTAQGRIDYSTGPNSARPGEDYQAVSGTLTWAPGEGGTKYFEVPIMRDAFEEEPQDFSVGIFNAVGGGILQTRREATVTIDDPAVRIEELYSSVYPAGANLTLVAGITALTVGRVEFLQGENIIGTATTTRPGDGFFEITWSNVPRGAYTIRARAIGSNGETITTTTSPARTILFTGAVQNLGLATVHVAPINNTGLENGSAQNPFTTIQKGIDNAAPNATVKIAAGTYAESILIDFGPLQILGGYSLDFSTRDIHQNRVTIVPPSRGLGIGLYNALGAQIDSLTISNAARGIYTYGDTLAQSYPKLTHLTITGCGEGFRAFGGGGIHAENTNLEINDSEISFNIGGRGAGISAGANKATIAMRNNLIRGNVGYDDHGGGLYIFAGGVIANNRIENNEIGHAVDYGGWGGGLIVFGNSFDFFPQIVLSNNIVAGNIAGAGSAEFFDEGAKATVSNELIYDNIGSGPAIYVDGCCNSSLQLRQSTVANNVGGGIITDIGSSAAIVNSIFWNPGSEEFTAVNGSTIQISYTLSEQPIVTGNGITGGAGNLSTDPVFADPANDDYRLKTTRGRWSPAQQIFVFDPSNSPAIDAANPASDFSFESIPNGGRADLGVYSNRSESHLTASIFNQQLRFSGRGNARTYFLETSEDLKTWTELLTTTSPTGILQFEIAFPSTPRFYRLRQ